MRPSVLLFDIDGTLISTGGSGRKSIERAFTSLHQRADACSHFSFEGMTDRAIVRLGLEAIGAQVSDANIDALLAEYVRHLAEAVRDAPIESYIVHPGAREAVHIAKKAGHAIGLGTGNIREGARIKLERVQLYSPFDFGGFGDDHELRPELIRAGAERGRRALGNPEARVVIIGDTPKDVHAARAIGAQSLAVTTGGYTPDVLRESGATWVFESLESPGALDVLLNG